ncbi:beta-ketoacyl-ACP reductase [Cupriavidus oxalaticus]|uniref:3-oxoacyl-[acyl-carrier-protein] reductase FabG n=1 Tax=Cupriavidus oxalaticus TaxID=96344 RepID=A0A5P3VRQ3_9BURK|nr:beta-ketoacyl-ACP reductase [Cupriavidus oxalaticus]QEZ48920.1 beta-ketoacyl-ACP reductase [Cupriavidus oxalaticus]
MDMGLQGRVAVVTGSGRGIGKAALFALAREGARVVVTDISEQAVTQTQTELVTAGFDAIGVVADVCNAGQVEQLVANATEKFGGVDILVNNAGFTRDKYLAKMSATEWDSVVDTILKGAYLCTKAVLPSMMERQWGRIINISSRAHLGNPGQTNYAAAKAGLIGFTRALALEQGKFNITANAIAPGFIETELVKALPTYERLRDAALARNPVPRLGRPDDIADAIVYLSSDRAGYITGETLHVTGGRYSS